MAQCPYAFDPSDDSVLYCLDEAGHDGPHVSDQGEGWGSIGPALVPVRFKVAWEVEEGESRGD